jgi:hypothetical protein
MARLETRALIRAGRTDELGADAREDQTYPSDAFLDGAEDIAYSVFVDGEPREALGNVEREGDDLVVVDHSMF